MGPPNPLGQSASSQPVLWTGGKAFDTVVVEFRSLTREVHLEKALDEDDKPLEVGDAGD
jgi:hypothetical protein